MYQISKYIGCWHGSTDGEVTIEYDTNGNEILVSGNLTSASETNVDLYRKLTVNAENRVIEKETRAGGTEFYLRDSDGNVLGRFTSATDIDMDLNYTAIDAQFPPP